MLSCSAATSVASGMQALSHDKPPIRLEAMLCRKPELGHADLPRFLFRCLWLIGSSFRTLHNRKKRHFYFAHYFLRFAHKTWLMLDHLVGRLKYALLYKAVQPLACMCILLDNTASPCCSRLGLKGVRMDDLCLNFKYFGSEK